MLPPIGGRDEYKMVRFRGGKVKCIAADGRNVIFSLQFSVFSCSKVGTAPVPRCRLLLNAAPIAERGTPVRRQRAEVPTAVGISASAMCCTAPGTPISRSAEGRCGRLIASLLA